MNGLIYLLGLLLSQWTPPEGIVVTGSEGHIKVTFDFVGREKKLTNEQLAWICEQPTIGFLDLRLSNVTERQLEAICRSVDLGGICLSFNHLDRKALPIIARSSGITEVRLRNSGICPNDLSALKSCQRIRVLTIGDDEWECRIDGDTLVKLESLQELSVTAKRMSNQEINKLGSLTNLSRLCLYLVEVPENVRNILRAQLPTTDVHIIPLKAGPFTWPNQRNIDANVERGQKDGKEREQKPPEDDDERCSQE